MSQKRLAPIVNRDFMVLVVPASDVMHHGPTIPEAITPTDKFVRIVARAKTNDVGCSFWAMKNPQEVSKVLRALADFIDHK